MCIYIHKVVSYGLIVILVLLDFKFQDPIMCLMTETDADCYFWILIIYLFSVILL